MPQLVGLIENEAFAGTKQIVKLIINHYVPNLKDNVDHSLRREGSSSPHYHIKPKNPITPDLESMLRFVEKFADSVFRKVNNPNVLYRDSTNYIKEVYDKLKATFSSAL